MAYATLDDKRRVEETPLAERWGARNVYEMLSQTAARCGDRPALSFQIKSGPRDKAITLNWSETLAQTTQAANLFRRLGVGREDAVAYLLPNCNETAIALLGGMTTGIVNPINPLLDPAQIAEILKETGAKALVTLAPFPKTDVAEKAAAAVAAAPNVETILEVDLKRYLSPPLSWIAPLIRPKTLSRHDAAVLDFKAEMAREDAAALGFANDSGPETIAAYFHTGGTTGMPKVARHNHHGAIYNGWVAAHLLFDETDVLLCPLPLFHVFAAYPVLMCCVASGGHMVMPTPAGYRGDGVFDNFWKLIERWGVTFMIMVPTAASALTQRKTDADISSLRYALCGSAPLPQDLFRRFQDKTQVKILEGYGMTEATCLVSCNPPDGEKKIGSVGLPFPYTDVRILRFDESGAHDAPEGEIGEICVLNPGTFPGYTDARRNADLFADTGHVRTGDLGRIDADGYLWITGRAKELIIRGGHNIDPAIIEETLARHPEVVFVGAIGQPDAHSGELPCAYVELIEGAAADGETLRAYAAEHVPERAAAPKYVEVMHELPKTAVGKVFKPELRRRAIRRVYDEALSAAGVEARVETVAEDKQAGMIAIIRREAGDVDEASVQAALGGFAAPWRWSA